MLSMVAASTDAMAQATARSRMRPVSTSRRSGSSSLLSFKPRTGRSGERITAAATTGPNSAPRPTSSTPATARKPRARNSRSMVASHRNWPPATSGRMDSEFTKQDREREPRSDALFEPGGLALQGAQVVELGAADLAGAHHINMVDHLGIDREDALHALTETDLSHGDAFAHPSAIAGDDGAFKCLQPFLVAFLDFDVDLNGVTGPEGGDGDGPLVLVNKLLD